MLNLAETIIAFASAQCRSSHLPPVTKRSQNFDARRERADSKYLENPMMPQRYFINRTQLDLPATRRDIYERS